MIRQRKRPKTRIAGCALCLLLFSFHGTFATQAHTFGADLKAIIIVASPIQFLSLRIILLCRSVRFLCSDNSGQKKTPSPRNNAVRVYFIRCSHWCNWAKLRAILTKLTKSTSEINELPRSKLRVVTPMRLNCQTLCTRNAGYIGCATSFVEINGSLRHSSFRLRIFTDRAWIL
jgi:hypothetical protein